MKFYETFISDVFQNSQQIEKIEPKIARGCFLNHSTVFIEEIELRPKS